VANGPQVTVYMRRKALGPGAEWPQLIEAALRPGQHTRVRTVGLFFVAATQFRAEWRHSGNDNGRAARKTRGILRLIGCLIAWRLRTKAAAMMAGTRGCIFA
jgi:hypothetical protein